MTMNVRMLPPGNTIASVGTLKSAQTGRSYSATAGTTVDVPEFDVPFLEANGWVRLAYVGTTAQRPAVPAKGVPYIDTTISKVVVHEGNTWRDLITGTAE